MSCLVSSQETLLAPPCRAYLDGLVLRAFLPLRHGMWRLFGGQRGPTHKKKHIITITITITIIIIIRKSHRLLLHESCCWQGKNLESLCHCFKLGTPFSASWCGRKGCPRQQVRSETTMRIDQKHDHQKAPFMCYLFIFSCTKTIVSLVASLQSVPHVPMLPTRSWTLQGDSSNMNQSDSYQPHLTKV